MASNCWSSSLSSLLPNDVFVSKDIFLQLFNSESIWHLLSDTKQHELLNKYLPNELSNEDKASTIQLLLTHTLTRFNSDLLHNVFINLKLQKMNSDLIKAFEDVKQLRKKLFKLYEQKRQISLFNEVMQRRKQLLDVSINSNETKSLNINTSIYEQSDIIKERVCDRFRKEMKDIRSKYDTSEEEEDDDINKLSDKASNKLNVNNLFTDKQYTDMLRKHKRKRKARELDGSYEPTLETNNISLSDIIMRVTNSTNNNSNKQTLNNGLIETSNKLVKSSSIPIPRKKPKNSCLNKSSTIVLPKCQSPTKLEKHIDNDSIKNDNLNVIQDSIEIKSESSNKINSTNRSTQANNMYMNVLNVSPHSDLQKSLTPTSSMSPLISNADVNGSQTLKQEKPPVCFFSLLRDIFQANAANDFRLTLHKLEELVKEKLRCFSPYMGWTSDMVASAMNYLSGILPPPHLVPLVDYKEKNQQWQWIGGGRDLDSELLPLSEQWMKTKDDDPTTNLISFSQSMPPPAKCQTDWIVRPSNDEEKQLYRKQEAIRYNNPYKAFTYRVHGYESVVGPVKGCGIGGNNGHNSSSPNKAREHSLLVSDRPPFVTLLSLVRDAAARLPNGEGTRADICELLKDSQYLLPSISDQQVNGIVSGALDRLHYEKDPCVKYDVNRKVWIYLHRNRTEAEFERLHEVQIAAAKAKRTMNKASRKTNCVNNQNNSAINQNQNKHLSIISKTTQQAIHQAVTNILNSEALKIPTKSSSVENAETSTSSSLECLLSSSEPKNLLGNVIHREKDISSNEITSFNGPNSLFLPKQEHNHMKSKPEVTNNISSMPLIDKKKLSKLKEAKICDSTTSLSLTESNKNIIVCNAYSTNISTQPKTTFSVASNTDNITFATKFLANDTNIINKTTNPLNKARVITQTQAKQPIKVQIPKTVNLPLSVSQSSQKLQQSCAGNVTSESLPTLISVATNTLYKPSSLTTSLTPVNQCSVAKKIGVGQTSLVTTTSTITTATTQSSNSMHQISIPTSMLFGTRQGSVVLATPTGKSYMMAASGGSIVLQQNSNSQSISTTASCTPVSQTSSLAVRTLQGIRVIPVSATCSTTSTKIHTPITSKTQESNTQVVMASQSQSINSASIPSHHQFVARIITTSQANRGNVPQTQIVIPSSSPLQPLFLAHPQPSATSGTLLQHIASAPTATEVQKVAITIPPHNRTSST